MLCYRAISNPLGLVLRNQRDRFLLSYYQGIFIVYPLDEETNRFIWRYVFALVAHDNQLLHSGLWRADFHSQLCAAMPTLGEVTNVDKEIVQLLEGLPTSTTPTTPAFDTSEPSSYDTMLPTYSPRKHRMVPATHHRPLESVVQRYATMGNLQQPSAVQDPRNLGFM